MTRITKFRGYPQPPIVNQLANSGFPAIAATHRPRPGCRSVEVDIAGEIRCRFRCPLHEYRVQVEHRDIQFPELAPDDGGRAGGLAARIDRKQLFLAWNQHHGKGCTVSGRQLPQSFERRQELHEELLVAAVRLPCEPYLVAPKEQLVAIGHFQAVREPAVAPQSRLDHALQPQKQRVVLEVTHQIGPGTGLLAARKTQPEAVVFHALRVGEPGTKLLVAFDIGGEIQAGDDQLRRDLDAIALEDTQLPLGTRTRVTEVENRPILECRVEQGDKSIADANARPHQQRIAQEHHVGVRRPRPGIRKTPGIGSAFAGEIDRFDGLVEVGRQDVAEFRIRQHIVHHLHRLALYLQGGRRNLRVALDRLAQLLRRKPQHRKHCEKRQRNNRIPNQA